MIFNKVLGNIDKYKNLDNFHIEKIYINSDDALKRILRVNSDHNHEYGIALDENVELKDILLNTQLIQQLHKECLNILVL